MALTVTDEDVKPCTYCPALIDLNEDGRRDSNGDLCCETCYADGTAYVEPLDFELDSGAGW